MNHLKKGVDFSTYLTVPLASPHIEYQLFPGEGTLIVNHLKSIQRLPPSYAFGRFRFGQNHGTGPPSPTNIWKKPKMGVPQKKESHFHSRFSEFSVEFLLGRTTRNQNMVTWEVDLKATTSNKKHICLHLWAFFKNKEMVHFLGEEGVTMTGKKMARYQCIEPRSIAGFFSNTLDYLLFLLWGFRCSPLCCGNFLQFIIMK